MKIYDTILTTLSSIRALNNPSVKRVVRLFVSVFILFAVVYRIDLTGSVRAFSTISIFHFVMGFVLFNLSQWISTLRMRGALRSASVELNYFSSLCLYYEGMFVNLFFPGGLGGDAYKVYILRKESDVLIIGRVLFLERLAGFAALGSLALAFVALERAKTIGFPLFIWVSVLPFLPLIAFLLIQRFVWHDFHEVRWKTIILSFLIQILQGGAMVFLSLSVGFESSIYRILAVFFTSSAATVIPVTIGGAGLREFIFLMFYPGQHIRDIAVLAAFLFFVITALSSIAGLPFFLRDRREIKKGINTIKRGL